jgi:outer membrane protein assembly factor BamD
LLNLHACASKEDKDAEKTERALYQSAQKALNSSQYDYAVELFRKIELRFPFGRYAEQAQLESIYAYYKNAEFASASVAADRFIRQHPEHPNLDYAYYLKGLSNYHVDSSLTDRLLTNSSVRRDLTSAKSAFYDFKLLIETFPESDYLADAQKRMLYLRDLIARQEVEVAYYYMQRAAYVAAINRGKTVVEDYPGSTASADALAVLVHAYQEVEMNDLAEDSLKVLTYNFPDYEKLKPDGSLAPYDKLYYEEVDWLNFISFGYLNKNSGKNTVKLENDATLDRKAPAETETPRPLLIEEEDLEEEGLE